jgi:hypothetical protein
MSDHHKISAYAGTSEKSTAVNEAERRASDRQLFAATAEVIEEVTGARFLTRTMDLGPGGCFIDTTTPLPVGTKVHVKLAKRKGEFKTDGTVVYSQIGMGMGIAFLDLSEEQQAALESWLAAAGSEKPLAYEVPQRPSPKAADSWDGKAFRAVVRLIRLLVTKGYLTESEASSVLHDPVL